MLLYFFIEKLFVLCYTRKNNYFCCFNGGMSMDNLEYMKKVWEKIFFLNISEDMINAYLTLHDLSDLIDPPFLEEINQEDYVKIPTEYTLEMVLDFLKFHHIAEPINTEAIEHAIQNKVYYKEFLVAIGQKPIDGIDGHYEYFFNPHPEVKPIILEDGSVDYNTLGRMELVAENAHLAAYYPAVPGSPGYNVFGEQIPSQKEKNLAPLSGKGISCITQGEMRNYYASIEGKVELRGNSLNVVPLLTVEDVDATIGKIDFKGDVLVTGNVSANAIIRATGNITVNGHVEIARLIAGKDILLKNGMQGSGKGCVYAKGNVSAKFFEQTFVSAGGEVAANTIMNCTISCEKSITVSGKRGVILGGTTRALTSVTAYNIGNRAETSTIINVGLESDFEETVLKINNDLLTLSGEIEKLDDKLKSCIQKLTSRPNPALLELAKNYRLERSRQQERLKKLLAEKNKLLEKKETCKDAYILIQHRIHPNVRVTINGADFLFNSACDNITVKNARHEIHIYSNIPNQNK